MENLMKTMIRFLRTMMLMPKPWLAWLGLLVFINMLIPLYLIHTLEAKVVLITNICGMTIMTAIFSAKGFVRLLGIGHIAWVPMIPWLFTRLEKISFDNPFGYWLLAIIIINSLTLMIDTIDVIRYIRGERRPYLTLSS